MTEELYTSGFVLGARYDDSPAICYDTASAPESTTTHYRPLQIPHNHFTLWMVTPSRALAGARPVGHLKGGPAPMLRALESYCWR